MFQHVLVVLDRHSPAIAVQTMLTAAQSIGEKLSRLQIELLHDRLPLLLLSELDRQKEWSSITAFCNSAAHQSAATPTLIRPKSKLKVVGTASTVLNSLQDSSEPIPQTRRLEIAIASIAQLCKADLIILGLSQFQSIEYSRLIQMADCAVLTLKV